jgi:hypothetical protein
VYIHGLVAGRFSQDQCKGCTHIVASQMWSIDRDGQSTSTDVQATGQAACIVLLVCCLVRCMSLVRFNPTALLFSAGVDRSHWRKLKAIPRSLNSWKCTSGIFADQYNNQGGQKLAYCFGNALCQSSFGSFKLRNFPWSRWPCLREL